MLCKNDVELYKTCILPSMDYVFQILTSSKDFEMKEAGLTFFYNIADTLQADFSPFLEKLMDFTLKLAVSSEGVSYEKNKKEEFSLDTDSEEGDDEVVNTNAMKVKRSFLEEKAAAIHALGSFAQACPMQFGPYFEKVLAALEDSYKFFSENIRIQSIVCYKDLTEAMVKFYNNGVLPDFKKGLYFFWQNLIFFKKNRSFTKLHFK